MQTCISHQHQHNHINYCVCLIVYYLLDKFLIIHSNKHRGFLVQINHDDTDTPKMKPLSIGDYHITLARHPDDSYLFDYIENDDQNGTQINQTIIMFLFIELVCYNQTRSSIICSQILSTLLIIIIIIIIRLIITLM